MAEYDHGVSAEMIPPGAVTTADLYRELVGIRTDMAKNLVRLEVGAAVDTDHETRIRQLERFRYLLLGATIVVSAAVSAFGTWVASGVH
jgi:hypothetical protein